MNKINKSAYSLIYIYTVGVCLEKSLQSLLSLGRAIEEVE